MNSNSDSQCYFVQLQIDSYLDGELGSTQKDSFMAHVQACQDCARELHFAQTLHDAVLELPLLDCEESALEPIHRLTEGKQVDAAETPRSLWQRLTDLFALTPGYARYAMTAAAVAVLAVMLSPYLQDQTQGPQVANTPVQAGVPPEYSPEDVQQALQELALAIDYLNDISERTEVMIGDRFLITPLQDSLNASFERARSRRQDRLQDDPI